MLKHLIFLSIIIVLITLGNFLSAKPKLYAYVASLSSKGAMISKIDVAELRVTKQEPFLEKGTFGAPVSIVISPDGKEIYIGMEKSVYTIYGIEAKTLKTIRKYFSGKIKNSYDPFYTARLAISPSGNKLYARGMDTLARWVVIDVRNFDELKRDSIIEEFGENTYNDLDMIRKWRNKVVHFHKEKPDEFVTLQIVKRANLLLEIFKKKIFLSTI